MKRKSSLALLARVEIVRKAHFDFADSLNNYCGETFRIRTSSHIPEDGHIPQTHPGCIGFGVEGISFLKHNYFTKFIFDEHSVSGRLVKPFVSPCRNQFLHRSQHLMRSGVLINPSSTRAQTQRLGIFRMIFILMALNVRRPDSFWNHVKLIKEIECDVVGGAFTQFRQGIYYIAYRYCVVYRWIMSRVSFPSARLR